MPSINKVILIGNVTRDPEVKFTPKGTAMAEVGLAINRTFTQDGTKKEETAFLDVTLWGRLAEVAGEYAKKGSSLYVEGRLHVDTWEDKQSGQKRSKLKITGENIQLLGSKSPGQAGGEQPAARASQPRDSNSPCRAGRQTASDADGDDIPF